MTPLSSIASPSTRRNESDEVDLAKVGRLIWAQKWRVFGLTLCGALIAAAIAFLSTPIFQSRVVFAVVEDASGKAGLGGLTGQFGGLASLAGINLGGSGSRSESLGTLSSQQLLDQYLRQNQLLPILFAEKWDAPRKDWKNNIGKKPTYWEAVQLFSKKIRTISEDKKSGLVVIEVNWSNPVLAARWANDLVRLANRSLRERAIAKSESNLAYLNGQLEKATVIDLRQAIYRLIEAEVKNVMVAQGNEEYAFKVIDPAVVAEKKYKPQRLLLLVAGTIVGFLLGCFYVLLLARPTVSTPALPA